MHCLVVYDIPNDRIRSKVADICLDYGLDRIQFSAFVGNLTRAHQEALMKQIRQALGKGAGNIQLVAVCEKDWERRIVIEQNAHAQAETTGSIRTTSQPTGHTSPPKRGRSVQSESSIAWMPEREEELPPI